MLLFDITLTYLKLYNDTSTKYLIKKLHYKKNSLLR